MSGKTTIMLALLAGALLLFIVFVERERPEPEVAAAQARKLFPGFNAAAVRSIEFVGRSNATLRAERDGLGWKLTAPIPYPAQSPSIQAFLEALGELEQGRVISAADVARQTNGLTAYGLNPPFATVQVELNTNRVQLAIGSMSQMGDQLYFQPDGRKEVLTCGSNFFVRLPQTIFDWRDLSLVDLPEGSFDRMTVRSGARGFEVQRDTNSGTWKLSQPMNARADNPKLEHLFQTARAWRVSGFVTDDPTVDLEKLGLKPPELEVTFALGSNSQQTVQFGRSPIVTNLATNATAAMNAVTNFVYARRLKHTNIVLVHRTVLEALSQPFTEFRDRRLATFDPANITAIEVRAEDTFTLRRQPDQSWRVTEPLNFAADSDIVQDLLLSLGSLEIMDFVKDVVTDFKAYGLDKPTRQFVLKTTVTNAAGQLTNVPLVELQIGTNVAERIYARRADEESVYAVSFGSVLRMPQALYQVRDRTVFSFAATNVVSVTSIEGDAQRKFERDEKGEWKSNDNLAVNGFGIEETLVRLGQLKVGQWTARGRDKLALFGMTRTRRRLEVELRGNEGTRKVVLELGAASPQRRPYAATEVDGEMIVFECPLSVYEHIDAFLAVRPKL
jgi:hypothetical protein